MLRKKKDLIGEKFMFADEEYIIVNVTVYGRYFIIKNVRTGEINEDMKYFSFSIVRKLIESYKNSINSELVSLNSKEKEMILYGIKCLYESDSKKLTEENKITLSSIKKKLEE